MPNLPVVNTLWIGASLGAIERACLRSALRQGHRVRLFQYQIVDGVPDGVEVEDGRDILPEEKIVFYDNGSPSLFSNHFRYALQRKEMGLWVDTDHYFLKPHDFSDPYLFGRQHNGEVNGAVLHIPSRAPMLTALLDIFTASSLPPWANPKVRAQVPDRGKGPLPLSRLGWGFTGPQALTYLVSHFGLESRVKHREVFYPVSFKEAGWIVDPSTRLGDVVAPATVGVHLWNEKIKAFKEEQAPDGSFLARLQAEGS